MANEIIFHAILKFITIFSLILHGAKSAPADDRQENEGDHGKHERHGHGHGKHGFGGFPGFSNLPGIDFGNAMPLFPGDISISGLPGFPGMEGINFPGFGNGGPSFGRPPQPNPQYPSSPPSPQPNPGQTQSGNVGCGVQAPGYEPRLRRMATTEGDNAAGPPSPPDSRIINGAEARPHSWPWITGLSVDLGMGRAECGASLIRVNENVDASDVVVTAAHCVTNMEQLANGGPPQTVDPSSVEVVAGNHNKRAPSKFYQKRRGAVVQVHPNFQEIDGGAVMNDVAVVKLDKPILFNNAIRPICLPQSGADVPVGKQCVVAGWGRDSSQNENSLASSLQQLFLPVQSPQTCQNSWPGAYNQDAMICAGSLRGDSGACQGDSGGPLACRENDGRWVLYGTVSWGLGGPCLAPYKPGVFARVSNYVDWISQTAQQLTSLQGYITNDNQ